MTDENDRTQEIRRDADRFQPSGPPAGQGHSQTRRDDTRAFERPVTGSPGPTVGTPPTPSPAPMPPTYAPQPAAGYRPAPAPSYARPMLPADRGSGGFPAAMVGSVVATLIAVAGSFGSYQILKNHSSIDPMKLPGFVTYRMNLLPWPSGRGNDLTTAFAVGVLIVLVVTLLLMMVSAMSTRAGTGGFALLLAAWMATVIAGGVARLVAGAMARQGYSAPGVWQTDLAFGLEWGLMFGWIAALVLLIAHAMRRKPVTR